MISSAKNIPFAGDKEEKPSITQWLDKAMPSASSRLEVSLDGLYNKRVGSLAGRGESQIRSNQKLKAEKRASGSREHGDQKGQMKKRGTMKRRRRLWW